MYVLCSRELLLVFCKRNLALFERRSTRYFVKKYCSNSSQDSKNVTNFRSSNGINIRVGQICGALTVAPPYLLNKQIKHKRVHLNEWNISLPPPPPSSNRIYGPGNNTALLGYGYREQKKLIYVFRSHSLRQ